MAPAHEPLRYAHEEGHTDVCYTEDGSKFITCGADGDIRIWSTDEGEDPVHNCVGELAFAVGQKGKSVYVATGSNDIQILSLPEGDRDGVLDRFTAPINHIAVCKNSQLIALAGEDMEVKLIDLDRTTKEVAIFDGLSGPCLSVSLCPNSKFIASAAGDSKLRIWDIESRALIHEIQCFPKVNSFANAKILCRIHFEQVQGKQLAYPKDSTVLILNVDDWNVKMTLKCEQVSAAYSIVQYSPCGNYLLAASIQGDFVIWNLSTENVVSVSKHEKAIGICGLMWNPLGNGEVVYTDVEGQLGVITDAVSVTKNIESDSANVDDGNNIDFSNVQFADDDDDEEDNENVVSVEKLKQQYLRNPEEPELMSLDKDSSRSSTPRPRTPLVPLQSPFMPTSTPEHLDPRYMCWNEVGVIRSYANNATDANESKSIEVEFHDTTFHNSMMMQNYQEYTMGSISKGALVIANSSQINVIPLATSTKEWMLKVEEYEEIILIAASEQLICFAMANYIVRICSIYGTQIGIVSIPGPLISMSAFKNILMVAYHCAGVRGNDQCVNVKLFKFDGTSVTCKDIGSALGPESLLKWIGFSDMGTPAMMDSLGMLSMHPHSCGTWIPFCDTTKHRKNPGDCFFVTAVFEMYQAVGGIKCKGTIYPGFTPRPTLSELPLEPPFAESSIEKTQMEMNLFTWSNLQIPDVDKKYKETALKTFALACRNGMDERAYEFMEILSNPQIVTLGLKYASKLNKRRLVEKLMDLATKLADETDDLGVEEIATPEPNTIKPVYRKLSLNLSKNNTPKNKSEKLKQQVSTPRESSLSSQKSDVCTPVASAAIGNESIISANNSTINNTTQESLLLEEEKPNPFLKSLKKQKPITGTNPLSLTDRFAGIHYEKENSSKTKEKNNEIGEKRKLSDCDNEKQKEKQRRLDSFKFTKRQ